MKILHLLSNYKLTGPSEPVINLVKTQKQLGAHVTLASSHYTKGENPNQVANAAVQQGITPYLGLYLSKHRNPFYNTRDIYNLARYLSANRFDVIHCHMDNDHSIARVAGSLLRSRPAIVRTLYMGVAPPKNLLYRRLLKKNLDIVVPSQTVKKALVDERGCNESHVHLVEPAIDTDRFNPDACGPDKRVDFGVAPDDFVVGTGESRSVKDFVEEAFSYAGLDWEKYVKVESKYFRPTEVDVLVAESAKAKEKLDWNPEVKFKDLVRIMLDADMRAVGLEAIGEGDKILKEKFPNRWWGTD